MTDNAGIIRWSGSLKDPSLERAYRGSIEESYRRHNTTAIAIAVPLNSAYVLIDPAMLEDAEFALVVRLIALVISAALFALMHTKPFRGRHETITLAIILILGAAMNLIMANEPSLSHNYYVGLIQGGVFISFLLRLGFEKLMFALLATYSAFVPIAIGKGPPAEAALQSAVLFTMYSLCAFGVLIFERHRRVEFLQAQTIARQNAQLEQMLAEERLDNERKIAALNMLVHFVKTPVHQIVGFTDLITASLRNMRGSDVEDQLQHAEFIRRASADLSSNVANILAYHRLDEMAKTAGPERAPIADLLSDLRDELSDLAPCRIEGRPPDIVSLPEPLRACFSGLATHYRERVAGAVTAFGITLSSVERGLRIEISDDGPAMTPAEFDSLARPLTRITSYLGIDGSAMPMALRTAARAAEVCDGNLEFRREADKNILVLNLPDLSRASDGDDTVETAA